MTPQGEAKCLEQLDRIAAALDRIANAVECLTVAEPDEPPLPALCEHPTEYRIEFSGMSGAEEWLCSTKLGGCGYRYHEGS